WIQAMASRINCSVGSFSIMTEPKKQTVNCSPQWSWTRTIMTHFQPISSSYWNSRIGALQRSCSVQHGRIPLCLNSAFWSLRVNGLLANRVGHGGRRGRGQEVRKTGRDPQDWNGYSYGANIPLNGTDPTGIRRPITSRSFGVSEPAGGTAYGCTCA